MWHRGPFLEFLMQVPEEGLDTIIRLVNHATERWAESVMRRWPKRISFTITTEIETRELLGDADVYSWYHDSQSDVDSVVCALMALEKWFYVKLEKGESVSEPIDTIWRDARSIAFCGVLSAVGRKHPELFEGPLRPLLGMWVVHVWELYHHGYALSGADFHTGFALSRWSEHGEYMFNIARDWYQMPHRKTSFQEISLNLLFHSTSLRPFFVEVQKRWNDELDSLRRQPPSVDLRDLGNLTRWFDINNWKTRREGDRVFLECPGSDEEERARTEGLKRLKVRSGFSDFPLKCRRLLEEDKSLSRSELEAFWDKLIRLSEYSDMGDEQSSLTAVEDVVIGGMAVLNVLHSGWLEEHPERQAWCDRKLEAWLSTRPHREPRESKFTLFHYRCESFFADIAVAEWARDPEDSAARWFVAEIAMSFQYDVVGILMRRATRERDRLGIEYDRLQSLIVLWAALCDVWLWSRSTQTPWARADNWCKRALNAFVEKKIPPRLDSWKKLARASNRQSAKMRFRRRSDRPSDRRSEQAALTAFLERELVYDGLDLNLIKAAFQNLPLVTHADSREERIRAIFTHRNLLGITLRRTAIRLPENHYLHHHFGHPNDFDHWTIERIAIQVAQLGPGDESASLWKPILDLGPEAHTWIESYLRDWFSSGSKAALSVESFSTNWRDQINYALSSPRWTGGDGERHHELTGLLTELMGLGVFSYKIIGDVRFRETIASMSLLYGDRSSRCLNMNRGEAIITFPRFLRLPSAVDLLANGIGWIFEAVRNYDGTVWEHAKQEKEELVGLIEHWWNASGKKSPSSQATKSPAMGLLKILADHQHPRALEIQDRIARSW
ncbi:MAG: hypothetical protein ACLQGP_24135 [Isosphaeraceae bacterium]